VSEAHPDLLRRATTEAIGTFTPAVAGCGALITDARYDPWTYTWVGAQFDPGRNVRSARDCR
jgi:hypothetical protein